ncbi:MAG: DUF3073 domain-containing protein [Actinomycetota bacterium]|nr:DUF3073 domain-containing protein [Actinomycetota bacterium]
MGRGRAKAKQTKVARDLKYRAQDTDFSQLQRELHGEDHVSGSTDAFDDDDDAAYADRSDSGRPGR